MCLWPSGSVVATDGMNILISKMLLMSYLIVRYRAVAVFITIIVHH